MPIKFMRYRMNHDLIQSLVDIYNEGPETDPNLAVRRLAVLLDQELKDMEEKGTSISRASLLQQVQESLKKYPNQKAS